MTRAVAVVQARTGSTRLPGKVLRPIAGRPLLALVVDRLRRARSLADVVVATSDLQRDLPIVELCRAEGVACHTGSETDVLDRFHGAAAAAGADPVVRVTADCPLVDPEVVDRLLDLFASGGYDYAGVATGATPFDGSGRYPDGLDVECFSFAALDRAWREARDPYDREHVTPYLYRVAGRFRSGRLTREDDLGEERWTVDGPEDLALVERVVEALGPEAGLDDVRAFLDAHPDLRRLNRHLAVSHA
jgi:spore coat polysaccharide biosynthesis protein SpsF